jgi:hypothetical protein
MPRGSIVLQMAAMVADLAVCAPFLELVVVVVSPCLLHASIVGQILAMWAWVAAWHTMALLGVSWCREALRLIRWHARVVVSSHYTWPFNHTRCRWCHGVVWPQLRASVRLRQWLPWRCHTDVAFRSHPQCIRCRGIVWSRLCASVRLHRWQYVWV